MKNLSNHAITFVDYSLKKGVFAASVRRSCGNKRCGLTFQGSSAISNTCCSTALCNRSSIEQASFRFLLTTLVIMIVVITI
jgi:hypothetical protein